MLKSIVLRDTDYMSDAFEESWQVVKADAHDEDKEWRRMQDQLANHGLHEDEWLPEWDGFDPDHDTCNGCGGQMTPQWPGYGPDGPDNGNCDSEMPECDLNLMLQTMADGGHWGQMGLPHDWDTDAMIAWIRDERAKGNQDFPDEQFYDRLLEDEK